MDFRKPKAAFRVNKTRKILHGGRPRVANPGVLRSIARRSLSIEIFEAPIECLADISLLHGQRQQTSAAIPPTATVLKMLNELM